eukprot:Gb_31749 [translate_table: standard]
MAHRLLRDLEADGWERSDFPIICESCLGDNPYVLLPCTSIQKSAAKLQQAWNLTLPNPRQKQILIRSVKFVQDHLQFSDGDQAVMQDLEYGLPVQVRDTTLAINTNDAIPKSDVNREYFAEEQDRKARAGIDYESSYGKARPNDTILKLQRTTPYYKRNRAHVCSFYVRGECTRGAECPYRHEMPVTGELSQQNIKDRYYGVNDPVAAKLLNKAGEMPSLVPPEDETIKTLYVGGLDPRVTEDDLKDNFYAYGEIESIRLVLQRACAFIAYTTREGAEKAADQLSNKLVIKGLRLKLMWGKPQVPKAEDESQGGDEAAKIISHSCMLPRSVISQHQSQQQPQSNQDQPALHYFNIPVPPPPFERVFYPSMDPQRMGAVAPAQDPGSSNQGTTYEGQESQHSQQGQYGSGYGSQQSQQVQYQQYYVPSYGPPHPYQPYTPYQPLPPPPPLPPQQYYQP